MGLGGQGMTRPLDSREEPSGRKVPYTWLGNICYVNMYHSVSEEFDVAHVNSM